MGFGFKQPLVGEKRYVTTLITAAEETKQNGDDQLNLCHASATVARQSSLALVIIPPATPLQFSRIIQGKDLDRWIVYCAFEMGVGKEGIRISKLFLKLINNSSS